MIELYFRVLYTLLIFRPDKIYFTASISGVAFYRDFLISSVWKIYSKLTKVDIFYHYHTKGINNFISTSKIKLKFTKVFLKDINLILLSPMLLDDFNKIDSFKDVYYLPNGVEDNLSGDIEFIKKDTLNILYLSNMIKSKGYFSVLELVTKTKNINFNFAGGWQNKGDEVEFLNYIKEHKLENRVNFYGFVNGEQKRDLFVKSDIFVFPTKYENEAFPLTILEALSYGLPIISTNNGSIPYIVDNKSGIIIDNLENLLNALNEAIDKLINKDTSIYCRERYLKNFTLDRFEDNFIKIFKDKNDV